MVLSCEAMLEVCCLNCVGSLVARFWSWLRIWPNPEMPAALLLPELRLEIAWDADSEFLFKWSSVPNCCIWDRLEEGSIVKLDTGCSLLGFSSSHWPAWPAPGGRPTRAGLTGAGMAVSRCTKTSHGSRRPGHRTAAGL